MFVIFVAFNFSTPQNYKHCLELPKLFAIFFQENVRFFLTKSVNYQQLIETQTIMEKEDFTMKMKFFFKKRGIKQNDLAKQLGVSHPVVRKGSTADTYRLECYNVDYDTTEIPKSLIEHIWQVIMCVKREVM